MREVLYTMVLLCGILILILSGGTRKGERRAKLSRSDLAVLSEARESAGVLDANITNVRVLFIVADDNVKITDSLAKKYCADVIQKGALAKHVKIVRLVNDPHNEKADQQKEQKYSLVSECQCAPITVH
ncbi:MAG TPA: hypothetical protein VFU05_10120 [Cyclobacteriaceae bacterium]|nr:hypothetical protein [Cyclobacteriaceae bacterium]